MAVLVRHDPVPVRQLDGGRHPGAIFVRGRLHVGDHGPPCDPVGGRLVDEFLPEGRVVALVRVEHDELVVMEQDERLPDGREAVVREGLAAGRDVADEGPRVPRVGGGVQVDGGQGEIRGDGVAREEDGARGKGGEGPRELVEEGLVAEAPVVDLVVDVGDVGPGGAVVEGLVNGEVDQGGFGGVVLPGREEGVGCVG